MSFSLNIFQAASNGNIPEIERYLSNGFDVNTRDKDGITPLCWALEYPQRNPFLEKVVRFLIDQGADVNIQDNSGKTALYRASLNRIINIAHVLLEEGAIQEFPSAVLINDRPFAYSYIGKMEDVNIKIGRYTPLQWIAHCSDDPDIASYAIRNGADMNEKDEIDGRTSLHIASTHCHTNIIRCLLLNGSNPNSKDLNDQSPLHIASRKCSAEATILLVEGGADPMLKSTRWGFTALYFASSIETREYLKVQGVKSEMHKISRILFIAKEMILAILKLGWT